MKKTTLCAALAVVVAAALSAQEAPAFDDPRATVIDINAVPGKAKDEIRVINATHESLMTVSVSVYEAKKRQWLPYGVAELTSLTDTDQVDSKLSGSLKKYSHVAVLPSVNKDFKILARKDHNDLYISVLSLEEPSEYATVMDAFALNGTFKDNVRLVNQSDASNVGFDVYTQKDNSDTWFKVGTAFLKGKDDTCFVHVVTPDPVASYRYFAVIAHDGIDYTYEAKKENSDLIITVR